MTMTEFLDALAGVRDRFDWSLTADVGHHTERRAKRRFHLQGTLKEERSITLEPLRALCYLRTGIAFGPDGWRDAAGILGMDDSDAEAVVAAANDRTWTGPEGRRVPEERLLSVRRQLLRAVGVLNPDADDARA